MQKFQKSFEIFGEMCQFESKCQTSKTGQMITFTPEQPSIRIKRTKTSSFVEDVDEQKHMTTFEK